MASTATPQPLAVTMFADSQTDGSTASAGGVPAATSLAGSWWVETTADGVSSLSVSMTAEWDVDWPTKGNTDAEYAGVTVGLSGSDTIHLDDDGNWAMKAGDWEVFSQGATVEDQAITPAAFEQGSATWDLDSYG